MRRSLPATSRASRHMGAPRGPAARRQRRAPDGAPPERSPATRPPAMVTTRSASGTARSGSWEESSTAAPPGRGLGHQLAQQRAGPRRRARRGARRAATAPGARATSDRQGHPPPLAGREPADRGAPEPADEAQPLERRVDAGRRRARPPARRTGRSRPRSARRRGGRRGPAGPTRRRTAVAVVDQVVAEDHGLARGDRQQAGAGPQQAGLARRRWARGRTTTSPGATSRSTPERAGNRPASATAGRRWTAGAMTSAPCYGARWRRGQAGRPGGAPALSCVVSRWSPRWLSSCGELGGQPAQLAGQQQDPEDDQDAAADQVDHPEAPPGPGVERGQAAEGQPGDQERDPQPERVGEEQDHPARQGRAGGGQARGPRRAPGRCTGSRRRRRPCP